MHLKAISFLLITSIFVAHAQGSAEAFTEGEGQVISYQVVDKDTKQMTADIQVETDTISIEDLKSRLQKATTGKKADTVIVSSDEALVLQAAAELAKTQTEKNIALLPFGKAVPNKNLHTEGFNKYLRQITDKKEMQVDHIGLVIMTYCLARETIMWVHADNLSDTAKTANIIFSIATAAIFSVNKDSWAKATKPLQKSFRQWLGLSKNMDQKSVTDTGIKFASSLALASAISLGRVPLLSMDHLADQTFQSSVLTMSMLVALVSTVGSFSWLELVASINEQTHPKAKFLAQRMVDARAFLLGTYATTAMLLNYEHYGISPWVIFSTIGATGLATFFNSKKISDFVEKTPIFTGIQNAFKNLKNKKGSASTTGISCGDVLAF